MSRTLKVWIGVVLGFVAYAAATWWAGRRLAGPADRAVLTDVLWALGAVAAVALLWFLLPRKTVRPVADDVDTLLAAAAERLATRRAGDRPLGRAPFARLPAVVVLGPEASAKTTSVVHSGLEPELLAGAVYQDDLVAPTPTVNVWYARGTVLVEAGPAVSGAPERWAHVVRRLQPDRRAAVVGRGAAAKRVALVCLSCEELLRPDGGALEATARALRARLAELSEQLGVPVPVYVLFTKLDRVRFFAEYTQTLTREESLAVFGETLPLPASADAGLYAERETARVGDAFARLFGALAERRTPLLAREHAEERRWDAFEFPREFRKLGPPVTRFLVELCRPSQLGVSPFLRGFYFSGVQAVVVRDEAPAPAAAAAVGGRPAVARATDATGVFRLGAVAEAPALAASPYGAAPYGATPLRPPRKVPRWLFLGRLFDELLLADAAAAAVTGAGVRVRLARRAIGAGAAALALGLAVAFTVSYANNRALADDTRAALADVAALPAPGADLPSTESLRRLDTLRARAALLDDYAREGAPLGLRWGLYAGDPLAAPTRAAYFAALDRQGLGQARRTLAAALRALPDAPTPSDDYGRAYAQLKAYLVTTAEPVRSTPEFLTPVLLASWTRDQPVGAEPNALLRRQLDFYARELPVANPWPAAADAALVGHARDFLARFTGPERIYQYMLAEASKGVPPARLADVAPLAAGVVTTPGDMPGAFTARGWAFMQDAFRHADRFFAGERWVVGDAVAAQGQDRDRVLAELRARYRADYVARWRSYVRGLAVARAAGARDAAQKLGTLGGAQSPLLAGLALAARNTAVDSAMKAAFQPVHAVASSAPAGELVTEANRPYAGALLALQGAVEQVGNLPPPVDTASALQVAQAGQQALGQAAQAKVAARQLAQKFSADTAAAAVGPAVAALLVAPIESAEGVLRGVAATRPPARVAAATGGPAPVPRGDAAALAAALNERGRALCAAMTPVLAKFPFNPDAPAEASLAEVNAMFAPGTGALWALEQERLEGLVEKQGEKQGARFVPRPGAPVALSAPFLAFLNRALQVSTALYGDAPTPNVVFTARGAGDKAATLVQGAQVAHFGKDAPPAQFVWPSTSGREARLDVGYRNLVVFGRTKAVARAGGEWALFRVVAQATKWEGGGGTWRAEWNAGGQGPVAVEFTFANGAPVLQRGWLGGMACAAQVTR
ncbi:hypothetical protein tb265_17510 [Gemmatimonadetes bacterium T265]|nr:hypothetical protein tb265_17510 [Gemmatimonadetes bacterium T265]